LENISNTNNKKLKRILSNKFPQIKREVSIKLKKTVSVLSNKEWGVILFDIKGVL
jgi:hypothetical protein